ncbi:MAG: flagellar hook assembly protein FlgD [Ectothiorhodospiraceae bacterium]|nr:flagellar hook assembly protein FlgD [Ectothiorhodospiraceae bacterium]MCH8504602.1 flagellar hook assembly protein FlgD [Ectothiorhodospiraceae bacterium]
MFDLSALSGGNGAGGSTQQPKDAQGNSELGQDQFLKLMITQFQNQDPFQPMESGEFLGQLAHFTTANGIGELQKSFDKFAGHMMTDQALRAAPLVGRDVLVESGHGYLGEDQPLKGAVKLPSSVEQLTLKIHNSSGELVREIPMGQQSAGQLEFSWDGKNASGQQLPAGTYKVSAEGYSEGKTTGFDILASARVTSVSLGQNGESPTLNLQGLGEMKLSAVRHIQ